MKFLNSNVNPNMTLLSIVDTFGRMCRMDINCEDEMFLFESGSQFRNGMNNFMFSLVRQSNLGEDEPIQLHLDVAYRLTDENESISECSWCNSYGDMIQAALLSKAFEICKNQGIIKIEIWADKT